MYQRNRLSKECSALKIPSRGNTCTIAAILEVPNGKGRPTLMNWKRLIVAVLTALAMMAATYMLPRGGAVREASLAQFPMTVGVWAIFVLFFVKLK